MVTNVRGRMCTAVFAALAAATLLGGCSGDLSDLDEGFSSISANNPRETALGPGRWRLGIGAFTENPDVKLLYRAAIHARAAGFTHFQIVDYADSAGTSLDMVGTNDPAAPVNCMAEKAARAHCATWSAEEVLATRGKLLNKSPSMIADDVAIARIQEPRPAGQ